MQRFNKKLAAGITSVIGTMWTAYVFALLSLCSLPAILTQAFHLTFFPGWLISASLIALVAWVSSYFLQLVLLPILMVGQNVQGEASDARAAKTFNDTEVLLDRTDLKTAGGLAEVMAEVKAVRALIEQKGLPMSYAIMADAIHADATNIPASIPKVAGYVTGTPDICWTATDWAHFPSSGHVRIDQSVALASWAAGAADVADMEMGAATQATVIQAALERKAKGWWSFVYVAEGNYTALQAAVQAAGLTGHVQYWIADWNLDEAQAVAQLGGDVVAVQYASPSSDPDMLVPGDSHNLAQANADISVTVPSWFQFISATPPATGLVVTSDFKTYAVTSADEVTWKVS